MYKSSHDAIFTTTRNCCTAQSESQFFVCVSNETIQEFYTIIPKCAACSIFDVFDLFNFSIFVCKFIHNETNLQSLKFVVKSGAKRDNANKYLCDSHKSQGEKQSIFYDESFTFYTIAWDHDFFFFFFLIFGCWAKYVIIVCSSVSA